MQKSAWILKIKTKTAKNHRFLKGSHWTMPSGIPEYKHICWDSSVITGALGRRWLKSVFSTAMIPYVIYIYFYYCL